MRKETRGFKTKNKKNNNNVCPLLLLLFTTKKENYTYLGTDFHNAN